MGDNILVSDIAITAPAAWSIKGVVGGLTVLWGPPGSYKTFLSIGMAICVSAGRSWFGCPVRQGPVLYILGEGGMDSFRRRVGEACRAFKVDINGLSLWVRGEALDLSTPFKVEKQLDGWDEISPVLIIVDTLSRCLPGDENSQETMQGFVNAMDVLRDRYQATVLVIHHEGKSGDVRGSTVLPGAVDVSIRAHVTEDGQKRKVMHLEPHKLREMATEAFSHGEMYAEKQIIRNADGSLMLDDFGDRVETLVIKDHPDHAVSVDKVRAAFDALVGNRPKGKCVGYKEWLLNSSEVSASTFKRALSTIINNVDQYGIISPQRGQYIPQSDWPTPHNPLLDTIDPGSNYDTEEDAYEEQFTSDKPSDEEM
jgi:hypothetical protein